MSILERLDLPASFAEAAAEAFKDGIGDVTKDAVAAHGVSVVWSVLASEGAQALAGTIAGPLLHVLLRVADRTQGQLKKVMREPFISGTAKVKRMWKMKVITTADRVLRDAELTSALKDLNKAYSYADPVRDYDQRIQIRFLQVSIAIFMDAPGYAQSYGAELIPVLDQSLSEVQKEIIQQEQSLEELASRRSLGKEELARERQRRLAELRDPSFLFEVLGSTEAFEWKPGYRENRERILRSLREGILKQTAWPPDTEIALARSTLEQTKQRSDLLRSLKTFLEQ